MAFSVSVIKRTTFGDQRVVMISAVADANSGVIETGLSFINGLSVTANSAATNGQKFKRNLNAAGSTSNGSIMASSCANGEVFFIFAYGV